MNSHQSPGAWSACHDRLALLLSTCYGRRTTGRVWTCAEAAQSHCPAANGAAAMVVHGLACQHMNMLLLQGVGVSSWQMSSPRDAWALCHGSTWAHDMPSRGTFNGSAWHASLQHIAHGHTPCQPVGHPTREHSSPADGHAPLHHMDHRGRPVLALRWFLTPCTLFISPDTSVLSHHGQTWGWQTWGMPLVRFSPWVRFSQCPSTWAEPAAWSCVSVRHGSGRHVLELVMQTQLEQHKFASFCLRVLSIAA